uniref:Uncharacterized protein n=1 Tax=Arundo donax TaxID=35708 RepID=A0A0A9BPL8_ARUDO
MSCLLHLVRQRMSKDLIAGSG